MHAVRRCGVPVERRCSLLCRSEGFVRSTRSSTCLCTAKTAFAAAAAPSVSAQPIDNASRHETNSAQLQDGPCAFVFQNPDHQVVMPTVAAEVALGTGSRHVELAELHATVETCLRRVRLWDLAEASTATLSGGQKQRLAIAAALAQGPPTPKVRRQCKCYSCISNQQIAAGCTCGCACARPADARLHFIYSPKPGL